MRLFTILAAIVSVALASIACSSSESTTYGTFGIACSQTGNSCTCALADVANTFVCDAPTVSGTCCADDGWPERGTSQCTCVSPAIHCDAASATASTYCTCSYELGATGSFSTCSGGTDYVCCAGSAECECGYTGSCPTSETKVSECSAATFPRTQTSCGFEKTAVDSCVSPAFDPNRLTQY